MLNNITIKHAKAVATCAVQQMELTPKDLFLSYANRQPPVSTTFITLFSKRLPCNRLGLRGVGKITNYLFLFCR